MFTGTGISLSLHESMLTFDKLLLQLFLGLNSLDGISRHRHGGFGLRRLHLSTFTFLGGFAASTLLRDSAATTVLGGLAMSIRSRAVWEKVARHMGHFGLTFRTLRMHLRVNKFNYN